MGSSTVVGNDSAVVHGFHCRAFNHAPLMCMPIMSDQWGMCVLAIATQSFPLFSTIVQLNDFEMGSGLTISRVSVVLGDSALHACACHPQFRERISVAVVSLSATRKKLTGCASSCDDAGGLPVY